jgi:hypothetical protein
MNGEGTFFFRDGGSCFSANWLDDFFTESGTCTRAYPDGTVCRLKHTDYVQNGRKRRKWEDGVHYDNDWRAVAAKAVLAKPLVRSSPPVEECSSGQLVNFRGKLIVVPVEVQVSALKQVQKYCGREALPPCCSTPLSLSAFFWHHPYGSLLLSCRVSPPQPRSASPSSARALGQQHSSKEL